MGHISEKNADRFTGFADIYDEARPVMPTHHFRDHALFGSPADKYRRSRIGGSKRPIPKFTIKSITLNSFIRIFRDAAFVTVRMSIWRTFARAGTFALRAKSYFLKPSRAMRSE